MAMTVISVVVVMSFALMAMAVMAQGRWDTADATFYGDMSGNATMAGPDRCKEGSTIVTATSFCPPAPVSLCNPPQKHFDLSMAMYMKIAKTNYSGSIPVQFRRVPCVREGDIGFEFWGNPFWISVLVYNVAGSGDVAKLSVRGSNTTWVPMTRSWGQRWQLSFRPEMVGQSLSFKVTTGDGSTVESVDVAPANWQFGQRYTGGQF
ncbi:hypothetical protein C4D60_Mb04t35040 [Musa balbisiana]|uniref:Expansin n=1 Tax=Musa balbisiana TaxID=52838 RepID=A0A4V4HA92_MUSBA|nr:hypothetical protein C4D60_Mb04t35040 [Musa balbisiana]